MTDKKETRVKKRKNLQTDATVLDATSRDNEIRIKGSARAGFGSTGNLELSPQPKNSPSFFHVRSIGSKQDSFLLKTNLIPSTVPRDVWRLGGGVVFFGRLLRCDQVIIRSRLVKVVLNVLESYGSFLKPIIRELHDREKNRVPLSRNRLRKCARNLGALVRFILAD